MAQNLFTRLGEYVGDLFEDSPYDKAINSALSNTVEGQQAHRPVTRSLTRERKNRDQQSRSPAPSRGTKTEGNRVPQRSPFPKKTTNTLKNQREISTPSPVGKHEKVAMKNTSSPGSYHSRCFSPHDVDSSIKHRRLKGTSPPKAQSFPTEKNTRKDKSPIVSPPIKRSDTKCKKELDPMEAGPSSPRKSKLKASGSKATPRSPERKTCWETADPESPPRKAGQRSPSNKPQLPKPVSQKLPLHRKDQELNQRKKTNDSPIARREGKSFSGSSGAVANDVYQNASEVDAPVSSRTRHSSHADSPNRKLPGIGSSSQPTTDSGLDLMLNSGFLVSNSCSDISIPSTSNGNQAPRGSREAEPSSREEILSSGGSSPEKLVSVIDVDGEQCHSLLGSSVNSSRQPAQSHSGQGLKHVDSDVEWNRRTLASSSVSASQPPGSIGFAAPSRFIIKDVCVDFP